ncbi:MAG TPA: LON peptidase substrate-binding domain-containing protein [Solirubrobacterales bacterium]|jgi:Lon protease-like protein|nr:LON peptidase substrate-binding domain-containing protein [Solirubrobacterales bacterium]
MEHEDGFPLFPLGMVLLPSEATLLHIFEDRYKDLAERCLDDGQQFGLVLTDDDGAPGEWGCATTIEQVIQRYDDGRLDVLVKGVEPIRVVEVEDRFSYPSARIERVIDSPAGYTEPDQAGRTHAAFAALLDALAAEPVEPVELSGLSAYEMAAQIELDTHDKQMLLELRDEGARLANLERIFSDATEGVLAARKLAIHAQSNGHVKRG